MNRTNHKRKTPADVWTLIERLGPGECWPYKGRPTTRGYGQMSISGTRRHAHVLAYETTVGPIPAGYVVDHTCHNQDPECHGGPCSHRLCCNPTHLEAVPGVVNMLRSPHHHGGKTHCKNGHLLDENNTRMSGGFRRCRTCDREKNRARKAETRIAKQMAGLIAA